MFRARDGVKFGANRVCPMCNAGWGVSKRKTNDVGISRTQRRAGALRTNVWARSRPAGSFTGPIDECAGAGRPAWGVLHEPAKPGFAGDGPADDQSGVGSREGIGAIGDGGNAASETTILMPINQPFPCRNGFSCRSWPMVVTGP